MAVGFFFGCDRERLFLFDFIGFAFVASLLVSSAFSFRPVAEFWRAPFCCRFVVAGRPRWVCRGRRLVFGNFFLLVEAPRWPLDCKFFWFVVFSTRSCKLLYFCSRERYFLSRLSHSFLINLAAARNWRRLRRPVP